MPVKTQKPRPAFDDEVSSKDINACVEEFPVDKEDPRKVLIPVLQALQEKFGYLPNKALQYVSEYLTIPYSEITGVVSFYSFFSTVPRGDYVVRVCLGTACYVRGGKEVLESFKQHLGIDVGDTTSDKMFSLEIGRCFGACGLAPVVMVNDTVHQKVNPTRVKELIQMYKDSHV